MDKTGQEELWKMRRRDRPQAEESNQLDETEWVRMVGLGRVELLTNGLGKQWSVLIRSENF
jgi:hypothetical protein